jgi:hypothetical protein
MCNCEQPGGALHDMVTVSGIVSRAQESAMAASSRLTLQTADQRPADDAAPEWSPTQDWRRKDTFIATLAHELRQSLSAMLAVMEVARIAPRQ